MAIAVGDRERPGDIDAFWQSEFRSVSGREYKPPHSFHPYRKSKPPNTACKFRNWRNNAFYCYDDASISWDEDWLQHGLAEFSRLNDMAPLAIIAHEWGHHIQNLSHRPRFSLQEELQADCYAGLYIAYADSRSEGVHLEIGDVREAMLTFFRIGDTAFKDSNWFASGVHGPPRSRALAFSAAFLTEDSVFCSAYRDYQPKDDVRFNKTYQLTLLPGSEPAHIDNGVWRVRSSRQLGDYTLEAQARTDVTSRPAAEQLTSVAERWFSPSPVRWFDEVETFDAAPGGTSANRRYEQTITGSDGDPRVVHGAVLLHVAGAGRGLLVDVYTDGPAPAQNEGWERLGDYLFTSLYGLQVR